MHAIDTDIIRSTYTEWQLRSTAYVERGESLAGLVEVEAHAEPVLPHAV